MLAQQEITSRWNDLNLLTHEHEMQLFSQSNLRFRFVLYISILGYLLRWCCFQGRLLEYENFFLQPQSSAVGGVWHQGCVLLSLKRRWRVLDKLARGSGVGNDWCSFHAFSTRNFDRGFREKSTCGGEKRFAAFKIEGTVRFLKMILHVVPDWTGLPIWT